LWIPLHALIVILDCVWHYLFIVICIWIAVICYYCFAVLYLDLYIYCWLFIPYLITLCYYLLFIVFMWLVTLPDSLFIYYYYCIIVLLLLDYCVSLLYCITLDCYLLLCSCCVVLLLYLLYLFGLCGLFIGFWIYLLLVVWLLVGPVTLVIVIYCTFIIVILLYYCNLVLVGLFITLVTVGVITLASPIVDCYWLYCIVIVLLYYIPWLLSCVANIMAIALQIVIIVIVHVQFGLCNSCICILTLLLTVIYVFGQYRPLLPSLHPLVYSPYCYYFHLLL